MVLDFEDKYGELVSTALEELRATTDITQMTPGSKARALLETCMRETANEHSAFSAELMQAFVKNAKGSNVDLIGELLGLTRRQASRNVVDQNIQVQKFYVENGVFGNINGASGFTIPAGAMVRTRTFTDNEEAITYVLADDVICAAAESQAFANIRALEFGEASNMGAGRLVLHNFEQYTDYLNDTLKTTNIEGIVYATETESDTNYKYRIINQTLVGEQANETAVRLAVLGVPGVADVLIDEYHRGIGSGAVYIKAIVPTVSDYMISVAQDAINGVKAHGNFIEARQPKLVGIEMIVKLVLYKTMSLSEETNLKNRVRSAIYQYINGLDINEDLEVDLLVRQILSVDTNIRKVGTTARPIDALYIWKYSASEDSRVRQQALSGYTVRNFERVVVEFSPLEDGADPIQVRI